MSELLSYTVDGKEYQVEITRKWMRTIQYRFRDGIFKISAPRLVSKATIFAGLEKFARGLIKRSEKVPAITDEYIYIFGDKYLINNINIDNREIDASDKNKLDKELANMLLDYVTERVKAFADEMDIYESYKVKVRNTKTRYGSNSRKTKTLAFSTSLIHYSKEIIDSVVVHELAHCKVFNHSKDFYNVVYQHCPNYNVLRKKLIHSEFK